MPKSSLKISAESYGPVSVLAVSGELDLTTADELECAAEHILAADPARLVVDLSGLKFTDCRGARALIALLKDRQQNRGVVLRAARPPVHRILDLIGLPQQRPADLLDLRYPRDPGVLADSRAGQLVRQSRLARSMSRHMREEARITCRTLATSEDAMAATLTVSAAHRPHAAERLEFLSQLAHRQAALLRQLTRPAGG